MLELLSLDLTPVHFGVSLFGIFMVLERLLHD